MVMMMVVVLLIVDRRLLLINQALNGEELLHVARDSDRTVVVETVLLLGFLQQLNEERVVDVNHRNHKPLLLLALAHYHRHTPFWDVHRFLLQKVKTQMILVAVVVVVVVHLVTAAADEPHFFKKVRNHPRLDNLFETENNKTIRKLKLKELGCLCYKKTEKGQGSEAEIASLKMVRAESVRDLGILLMINYDQQPTYIS
uniref:Uncharacterized protein n=1 Tax=Rosa rugosa TaxID=74645 RepID=J7FWT1_ROSRU|nr:hypothetical protein [Rosa rugosa]